MLSWFQFRRRQKEIFIKMSEIDNQISKKVSQVINLIETKDYSSRELITYFNNIMDYPSITEFERELLVKSVETKLRTKFPNAATKIFGGKGAKAQEILEGIFKELEDEFDWSNNRVGSRVKVGGSMINGTVFVCWYISYKNEEGINTGFQYVQETPEDVPFFEIDFRIMGEDKNNAPNNKRFPIEQMEDAISLYKENLRKVIL